MKYGGVGVILHEDTLDLRCKGIASAEYSQIDKEMEKYICLPKVSTTTWCLSVLAYLRVG